MSVVVGGIATIANGASLSDVIDLRDNELVGIIMPADWTAANLTFQAANETAGTFNSVYDSAGTELTVTAADDRHIVLNPLSFAGLRFIKVRSGTSGAAVNQGASRSITFLTRPHI